MQNSNPAPIVLFIHIPKTAGTTLSAVLENQYSTNQRFSYNNKDERFKRYTPEQIQTEIADKQLVYGHMTLWLPQIFTTPLPIPDRSS